MPKTTLKVKWRLGVVPQGYELKFKFQMKTIREFKLANNKLELIPDGVEKMSSLRHLDIQGNFLRFFPKV